MKPEVAEILMNKEAIAVDQDPLGKQAKRVRHENDQDIFVKPLQDGRVAVVMVNRGKDTQTITLHWADAGMAADKSVAIRDLWQHKDLHGQLRRAGGVAWGGDGYAEVREGDRWAAGW